MGALCIFDFDDDNELNGDPVLHQRASMRQLETFTGCKSFLRRAGISHAHTIDHGKKSGIFNPYPFFEPRSVDGYTINLWPRGIPLEEIKSPQAPFAEPTSVDSTRRVSVWQSLANIDPDVDAIYRMTGELPVSFSKLETALILPVGLMAPWNAQAVFVEPSAFLGLMLPASVNGRVSDIWRSFISTELVWRLDSRVAFLSPLVNQFRKRSQLLSGTVLYLTRIFC
jgi:hypothetical protein